MPQIRLRRSSLRPPVVKPDYAEQSVCATKNDTPKASRVIMAVTKYQVRDGREKKIHSGNGAEGIPSNFFLGLLSVASDFCAFHPGAQKVCPAVPGSRPCQLPNDSSASVQKLLVRLCTLCL